jgi:hypothetical protein
LPPIHFVDARRKLTPGEHEIYGTVRSIKGNHIIIAKRNGDELHIDASLAHKNFRFAEPALEHGLIARGTLEKTGVFEANAILHAKNSVALWPSDR